MARTTWRDLAADPTESELRDEARAAAGRALPSGDPESLASQVPGLQALMSERARLQQELDRLTGRGAAPTGTREARRFPMHSADTRAAADGSRPSARERAEARAMDIERPDATRPRPGRAPDEAPRRAGRADPAERSRPRSAAERLRRAAEAGAARVTESQAAWERHRDQLREARRQLGEAGLDLPGAERVGAVVDDIDQRLQRAGEALRSLEAGTRALSSLDLRRDGPRALEALARPARRLTEEPLRETAAGRRLAVLTQVLPEPPLRELPGEGLRSAEELLDARRLRALESLRERRAGAAERPDRAERTERAERP